MMVESEQNQVVPKGYKLTEVGILPTDWDCKSLGDLGDVVRGGSPRPAGDPKFFNGSFIPWLTVASLTNIPKSKMHVTDTATYLTELGSKQSRTLQPDTLIISNSGATLGVAKILGIKCCANDGIAAIINQKLGHKPFLVHYINTQTQQLHDSVATGNGQPNLNTELIRNIQVPFPPLEEQTAIANALSDVDALISELEKLIAKKQAIKTATMQQLLTGKKRLPQFANNKDGTPKVYKKSELGEIPEDWEINSLQNVIDKERGVRYGIVQPGHYDPNGRLMLRGQDYSKGWVSENDIFRVSHNIEIRYKNARLKANDLIITIVGAGTGYVEIVPAWLDGANLTQTTARMTIDDKLANPRFVKSSLLTDEGQKRIASFIKGNAQPGLNCSDIYAFKFVCPQSVEEQDAIATILLDMDLDIKRLEQRLSKTRQIKQGMMQELLTGKTRLLKPESK